MSELGVVAHLAERRAAEAFTSVQWMSIEYLVEEAGLLR
jgi:hypothetical protein